MTPPSHNIHLSEAKSELFSHELLINVKINIRACINKTDRPLLLYEALVYRRISCRKNCCRSREKTGRNKLSVV